MKRASLPRRPDWIFRTLVTALFAVGIWLLAMPWVPAIARCTMQRFHLQTGSFVAWAIQQPIPPMYSFANTTEVRNLPPGAALDSSRDSLLMEQSGSRERKRFGDEARTGVLAGRMINHFPTREFTFANARVRYLRDRGSKWFVLRSTYRGQTVKSVYRLDPAAEEGWTVTLEEKNEWVRENES